MKKLFTIVAACALLTACGDALSKVEKLSTIELAEDVGRVGALPDPSQSLPKTGLFLGLFAAAKKPVAPVQSAANTAVGAALIEAQSPADSQPEALAATVPAPKQRGIFGFMRAKQTAQSAIPIVQQAGAPGKPALETTIEVEPAKTAAVTTDVPTAQTKPRKGLFGLLAGARAKENTIVSDANVKTASLGPVVTPKSTEQKTSVFAKRGSKHKGPDAQIVPFGTALPPGLVARVCDLPSGRLGKEVEKFPARGRGYKIFDSNPSSGGARPFYVTGFGDKCARTFTAALALFGSPTMHEQLRYGLPSSVQPYSTTDKAYEGIKRSVCGVGKKKSCGAKIKLLEKDTVFISTYDRIGSNGQWSNILLHKGWVLATDRKG